MSINDEMARQREEERTCDLESLVAELRAERDRLREERDLLAAGSREVCMCDADEARPALLALLDMHNKATWEQIGYQAECRKADWSEIVAERGKLVQESFVLRAERNAARAVLRDVEWGGGTSVGMGDCDCEPCCPSCGYWAKQERHKPDCALAAALGKE